MWLVVGGCRLKNGGWWRVVGRWLVGGMVGDWLVDGRWLVGVW